MKFDISNYYLDIKRVNECNEIEKEIIHNYYRDMLYSIEENRQTMAHSLFLTLLESGFLGNVRNTKLNKLLNESECD